MDFCLYVGSLQKTKPISFDIHQGLQTDKVDKLWVKLIFLTTAKISLNLIRDCHLLFRAKQAKHASFIFLLTFIPTLRQGFYNNLCLGLVDYVAPYL